LNYFSYDYAPPADGKPFAVHVETAACPWNNKQRLARIAIKGREVPRDKRPPSNLVFLVDVSGSMDEPDKLPLVKKGLKTLVQRLRATDRVAIVVYAGAAGLVLPSTPGNEKAKILGTLDELKPEGSTNGAQGIGLAYDIAAQNFLKEGTNRVILATDGDFNVGTTDDAALVRLVEERAKGKVFLTTMGFGIGNHNDSMLEQIADKGNGQCFYVDTELETYKVFVEQLSGTLVTIAKDVKIQVEFNPAKVAAYRLLGYENRMLRTEDFRDDTKDAGEIGAGHTVTALYEIVPMPSERGPVEAPIGETETTELKYQKPAELTVAAASGELATVHLRYKQPEADKSQPLDVPVKDAEVEIGKTPGDFRFAAAVASFGMILRNSQYRGTSSFDNVLELAKAGLGDDEHGYRAEFVDLVKRAKEIAGKK
jgi:Ca-activated chloride channel family protein